MRFPWVSRELCASWENMARDATNRADDTDRRYDRLLTMYHELALRVAPPSTVSVARAYGQKEDLPVTLTPMETNAPVRSVVAQTIKEEADGNPKIAQWLQKRARELRAEGKKPDEVAAELRRWATTEVVEES